MLLLTPNVMLLIHFSSTAHDISRVPLFSSAHNRESHKQHYPFVFDSLAARKQATAYIGGTKVPKYIYLLYSKDPYMRTFIY